MFKLRKSFNNVIPNAKTLLHIFNHTIKPIILYGSEIWGHFSPNKFVNNLGKYISKEIDSLVLEKLHTRFCKYILGVRSKSSNDGSRGELGSLPMLYFVLINMIKYWCHLVKAIDRSNSILYDAFKMSEMMAKEGKDSWVGCIGEIFNYLDLGFLFNNPEKFKISYIMNKIKFHLRSKFINIWKTNLFSDHGKRLNSGNKLRTYRTFKNTFVFEPYLLIGNREQKQLFSKLRISDHSLEIEKGRYLGQEVKDRICKICKNEIEDEFHLLIRCKNYDEDRRKYFEKLKKEYKNFEQISDENKFIWLMSSEDKLVLMSLYKLLFDIYKKRNSILESICVK